MKQGIYEQVINNEIINELENYDIDNILLDKEKIDKEEAKVILSQYIEGVIRKSLNYIRDKEKDDEDKLLKQIEVCNKIINILAKEAKEEDIKKYKIDESGELLTSLYLKINNKRAINNGKAVRPVTAISQSSLFTGSIMEPKCLVS